ncbi:hypothetical protein BDZ91DRAFT_775063 [Kalaharituber pfeilii]|nr:hypothetical protein BDZ91DRAFT_775063 [Kalaharituber pfeilii]
MSPLTVDPDAAQRSDASKLPPLSALFVIYFDIKAGYTIAWKQTAEGVCLDGVEFKSLPPGLHNIKEDLVYFVHGSYAGVSAFINQPAAEEERNAMMFSVGILVPLSHGRLGRSWRHAENLKELARSIDGCKMFSEDTRQYQLLSDYYASHRIPTSTSSPPLTPTDSPSSLRYRPSASRAYKSAPIMEPTRLHHRTRSISDATLVTPATQMTRLSPHHPALSLLEFLDTFGPLVFPLYRAALSRKRILLITQAPVETACNFVYNISILSTIPLSVSSILPPSGSSDPSRLRPLFSIGVHDIPFLEEQSQPGQPSSSTAPVAESYPSWVACTTDGVLYLKSSLYDVVVTLPPPHAKLASKKAWPKIESPAGVPMKATQRDLRRYRKLRKGLEQYMGVNADPFSSIPGIHNGTSGVREYTATSNEEEDVCEKASWAELAYSGFLWWASAGEKRQDNNAEEDGDRVAPARGHIPLDDHDENTPLLDGPAEHERDDDLTLYRRRSSSTITPLIQPETPGLPGPVRGSGSGAVEMDIIAYFHRLTGRIIEGMAEVIEASGHGDNIGVMSDEEPEAGEEGASDTAVREVRPNQRASASKATPVDVWFSRDEMARMGLDRWSKSDENFLEEMGRKWWGREVGAEKGGICGLLCC